MFLERYKLPENVKNLDVPKTNNDVWDLMHKGNQVVDAATQRVQRLMAHGLSVILGIIDQIGRDQGGTTESHLQELTDATRLMTMGFSSLTQVRKELIRNSLGFPLAKFCGWDTPVGREELFMDLPKMLKERDDTRYKLGCRQQNKYKYV